MRLSQSFICTLLVAALASCGGGEDPKNPNAGGGGNAGGGDSGSGTPKAGSSDMIELSLEGNDQMKFDKTALSAKANTPIKLTLSNVGKLPKAAMGHNVVILKKGVDVTTWVTTKVMANGPSADNNFLPEAAMDDVLAHTKLLGPGESDSVEFTLPEAGAYSYVCTFTGHFAMMKGVLTAE